MHIATIQLVYCVQFVINICGVQPNNSSIEGDQMAINFIYGQLVLGIFRYVDW